MKKRVLFLYTELAEYFMACVEELSNHVEEIHIVRWPVNEEAPFQFRQIDGVKIYDKPDFDRNALLKLSEEITPDVIVCSGWVDKDYLAVCEMFYGKCPTVLTLDNWWQNSLKQRLLVRFAKWKFKSVFSDAWIPGQPQKSFAQKLGFDDAHISEGFYCADTTAFQKAFELSADQKSADYPHRILYLGRYLPFKGIYEMWEAFSRWKIETENDWELWCVGTGDDWEKRPEQEGIKHFGFLQPAELLKILPKVGAFVLPSHREPWGVAVHEMAAAGLPLLCSGKIGAATAFLEEAKNGFSFQSGSSESILKAFDRLGNLSDEELLAMGKHSNQLSQKITPKKWSETVLRF
ncbi:glycosyltransferase family 4 protein [Halocola ammonii]